MSEANKPTAEGAVKTRAQAVESAALDSDDAYIEQHFGGDAAVEEEAQIRDLLGEEAEADHVHAEGETSAGAAEEEADLEATESDEEPADEEHEAAAETPASTQDQRKIALLLRDGYTKQFLAGLTSEQISAMADVRGPRQAKNDRDGGERARVARTDGTDAQGKPDTKGLTGQLSERALKAIDFFKDLDPTLAEPMRVLISEATETALREVRAEQARSAAQAKERKVIEDVRAELSGEYPELKGKEAFETVLQTAHVLLDRSPKGTFKSATDLLRRAARIELAEKPAPSGGSIASRSQPARGRSPGVRESNPNLSKDDRETRAALAAIRGRGVSGVRQAYEGR